MLVAAPQLRPRGTIVRSAARVVALVHTGEFGNERHPPIPQLRGVVVAHAFDRLEACAGHQLGGASPTADVDQRVTVAVDHEHRSGDAAERVAARSPGLYG